MFGRTGAISLRAPGAYLGVSWLPSPVAGSPGESATGGLAAEGCAARGAPVARKNRSTQLDAGGAPDRRLECAFARRFCARRMFALSVRFSRRARAAPFPARERLVCTFSTRPSLIGTMKPTDESA